MHEPAFIAKGNGDVQNFFEVPDNFIEDRFREIKAALNELRKSVTNDTVKKANASREIVLKVSSIPKIEFVLEVLKRTDMFSLFMPMHRKIAAQLIDMLQNAKSLEEFEAYAVFMRDHINPFLFSYVLAIALLNRVDATDVILPTVLELFPDRFMHSKIFQQAREELAVVPDDSRVTQTKLQYCAPILMMNMLKRFNHSNRIEFTGSNPIGYDSNRLREKHRTTFGLFS